MAPRFGSHAQRGSTKNSCPPPCSQCNAIHAKLHCQGKDPSSRHELPNSKSPIGMVHSTDRTSLRLPSEDSAIPLCFFFTCCWLCLIVWLIGLVGLIVWLPLGFLLIAFGVLTHCLWGSYLQQFKTFATHNSRNDPDMPRLWWGGLCLKGQFLPRRGICLKKRMSHENSYVTPPGDGIKNTLDELVEPEGWGAKLLNFCPAGGFA